MTLEELTHDLTELGATPEEQAKAARIWKSEETSWLDSANATPEERWKVDSALNEQVNRQIAAQAIQYGAVLQREMLPDEDERKEFNRIMEQYDFDPRKFEEAMRTADTGSPEEEARLRRWAGIAHDINDSAAKPEFKPVGSGGVFGDFILPGANRIGSAAVRKTDKGFEALVTPLAGEPFIKELPDLNTIRRDARKKAETLQVGALGGIDEQNEDANAWLRVASSNLRPESIAKVRLLEDLRNDPRFTKGIPNNYLEQFSTKAGMKALMAFAGLGEAVVNAVGGEGRGIRSGGARELTENIAPGTLRANFEKNYDSWQETVSDAESSLITLLGGSLAARGAMTLPLRARGLAAPQQATAFTALGGQATGAQYSDLLQQADDKQAAGDREGAARIRRWALITAIGSGLAETASEALFPETALLTGGKTGLRTLAATPVIEGVEEEASGILQRPGADLTGTPSPGLGENFEGGVIGSAAFAPLLLGAVVSNRRAARAAVSPTATAAQTAQQSGMEGPAKILAEVAAVVDAQLEETAPGSTLTAEEFDALSPEPPVITAPVQPTAPIPNEEERQRDEALLTEEVAPLAAVSPASPAALVEPQPEASIGPTFDSLEAEVSRRLGADFVEQARTQEPARAMSALRAAFPDVAEENLQAFADELVNRAAVDVPVTTPRFTSAKDWLRDNGYGAVADNIEGKPLTTESEQDLALKLREAEEERAIRNVEDYYDNPADREIFTPDEELEMDSRELADRFSESMSAMPEVLQVMNSRPEDLSEDDIQKALIRLDMQLRNAALFDESVEGDETVSGAHVLALSRIKEELLSRLRALPDNQTIEVPVTTSDIAAGTQMPAEGQRRFPQLDLQGARERLQQAAQPPAASVGEVLNEAYQATRQQEGFSDVTIGGVIKNAEGRGFTADQIKDEIKRRSREGGVVLSSGDWSLASEEERAGAVDFGESDGKYGSEKFLMVRLQEPALSKSSLEQKLADLFGDQYASWPEAEHSAIRAYEQSGNVADLKKVPLTKRRAVVRAQTGEAPQFSPQSLNPQQYPTGTITPAVVQTALTNFRQRIGAPLPQVVVLSKAEAAEQFPDVAVDPRFENGEGFYVDGQVVIMPDGIGLRPGETPESAATRVILHETAGHLGLRDALGKWGTEVESALNDLQRSVPALQGKSLQEVEEYFARQIENGGVPRTGVLKRVWDAIVNALRRIFGMEKIPNEEAVIRELLGRSLESLRGGVTAGQSQTAFSGQSTGLVTPQQDAAYMQAVSAGDTATAQAMVDAAAKAAGYTTGPVYHHGAFDAQDNPVPEGAMHFGTKDAARERAYGKIVDDAISDIKVTYDEDLGAWFWSSQGEDSYDVVGEEGFASAEEAREDAEQYASDQGENTQLDAEELGVTTGAYLKLTNLKRTSDQQADWRPAIASAKAQGYDGIVYKNEFEDKGSDSFIAFYAPQIKSSEPVTRDAAGNVIPLSQRFNPASNDIRFSERLPSRSRVQHRDQDWLPVASISIKEGFDEASALLDNISTDQYQSSRDGIEQVRSFLAGVVPDTELGRAMAGNPQMPLATLHAIVIRMGDAASKAAQGGTIRNPWQFAESRTLVTRAMQVYQQAMTRPAQDLAQAKWHLEGTKDVPSFADYGPLLSVWGIEVQKSLNTAIARSGEGGKPTDVAAAGNRGTTIAKAEVEQAVVATEEETELQALKRLLKDAKASGNEEMASAIRGALRLLRAKPRKTQVMSPQLAGIREQLTKKGGQNIAKMIGVLTDPAAGVDGPLANFDDATQATLREVVKKALEDAGLSKRTAVKKDVIDQIVLNLSNDSLRPDKLARADELVNEQIVEMVVSEQITETQGNILLDAWNTALAEAETTVAGPGMAKRAVMQEIKAQKINLVDTYRKGSSDVTAERGKVIGALMTKINAATPGATRESRALLQGNLEDAFDQISSDRLQSWLDSRAKAEEKKRVAARERDVREAFEKPTRMIKARSQRIFDSLVPLPPAAKNRIVELIDEHERTPVENFAAKLIEQGAEPGAVALLEAQMTEIRIGKRMSDALAGYPRLKSLVQRMFLGPGGGPNWGSVFRGLQGSSRDVERHLITQLQRSPAFANLPRDERLAVAEDLRNLFTELRRKAATAEIKKLENRGKTDADRKKVDSAIPRIMQMLELGGVLTDETVAKAIAEKYGVKIMTPAEEARALSMWTEIRGLRGMLRRKKVRELVDYIARTTDVTLAQVVHDWTMRSILANGSTLMSILIGGLAEAMAMTFSVPMGRAVAAIGEGDFATAGRILLQMPRSIMHLMNGFMTGAYTMATGDTSMLSNYTDSAQSFMEEGRTVRGVERNQSLPIMDAYWRNMRKNTRWLSSGFLKKAGATWMEMAGRMIQSADIVARVIVQEIALDTLLAQENPDLLQRIRNPSAADKERAYRQAVGEIFGTTAVPSRFLAMLNPAVKARMTEILGFESASEVEREQLMQAEIVAEDIAKGANLQKDPQGLARPIYRVLTGAGGILDSALGKLGDNLNANAAVKPPIEKQFYQILAFLSHYTGKSMSLILGVKFARAVVGLATQAVRFIPASAVARNFIRSNYPELFDGKQNELLDAHWYSMNIVGAVAGVTLAGFADKDDDDEGWHIEGSWDWYNSEQQKKRRAMGLEPLTAWKRNEDGSITKLGYGQFPFRVLFAAIGSQKDHRLGDPKTYDPGFLDRTIPIWSASGIGAIKDVAALDTFQRLISTNPISSPEERELGLVKRFQESIAQTVTGIFPKALKDLDQALDANRYTDRQIWGNFIRGVPFARRTARDGQPDITLLGRPVEMSAAPWRRFYKEFVPKDDAEKVMFDLIARGVKIPAWDDVSKGLYVMLDDDNLPVKIPDQVAYNVSVEQGQALADILASYDLSGDPETVTENLQSLASKAWQQVRRNNRVIHGKQ